MIRRKWLIIETEDVCFRFQPGMTVGKAKRKIRKMLGLKWYERLEVESIEREPCDE